MVEHINRRTVIARAAAILPVAAAGGVASAFAAPALTQLIEHHRAAHRAFCDTLSEDGAVQDDPAYDAASDAEYDALFELCSYRCTSIEEARVRAAYLLTTADVRDDVLPPEHFRALLKSFLAA